MTTLDESAAAHSVQSSRYGNWLSHDVEAGVWSQYNDGFKGIVYGGEICHGKLRRVVVAFVVVIIFLASNNKTTREEGIVPCLLNGNGKR
eukprot:scaffold20829_cov76-Skeletonema_dohrnii-CCMP3373.AAC.2